MTTSGVKGVFCLEGNWEKDLKSRTSMGPVLELLEKSGYPSVPYILSLIHISEPTRRH